MSHSFSSGFSGLSRQLKNKVRVVPHANQEEKYLTDEWMALWDTGATGTVISKRIVDKYGLVPVSYHQVTTPQGTYDAACYYVEMHLPNGVCIQNLLVTEGILPDFDVLVGMDIITLGDFAVTNYNNRTIFTFRVPSSAHIDFVNGSSSDLYVKTGNELGRNKPCPCGSGKKYKHCCGNGAN